MLGSIFLKKYYMVFDSTPLDQDSEAKNRIGLAIKDTINTQDYSESNITSDVSLQFLIAAFLLVAFTLFFVCTYLYCKRKQNEEDENILANNAPPMISDIYFDHNNNTKGRSNAGGGGIGAQYNVYLMNDDSMSGSYNNMPQS